MFKKFVDNLTKTLGMTTNKIEDLIKGSNQYITALESLTGEVKKTIDALEAYAESETPSLGEAIKSLASTFDIIEKDNTEKAKRLREEYIAPLNGLLGSLKTLETEQAQAEKTYKDLEKAEKHLSKVQNKPKEKLKPNEMETAEAELNTAKETATKEEADVKSATQAFNKEKLETLQKVLKNMVDIETVYHKKVIDSIANVGTKADAIKVEEESKV